MKYISFEKENGSITAGILLGDNLAIDMHEATDGKLPASLMDFLECQEELKSLAGNLSVLSAKDKGVYPLNRIKLLAPLPQPRSFRDFYAFEQHVKTARENRGLEMIPDWYDIPVFYFSNHLAITGPYASIQRPALCGKMDFELEIACVIGKEGRNILAEEAEEYIFGYCILNDWSARDLQQKEMKVGLGPAKGKDFATSIGPWIVTKDELETRKVGKGYNLAMKARVNGKLISEGNMSQIYYSFGEMIERASNGVTLYPGEILGSGTVGTGCILELGADVHRWLEPGDEIELEIDRLGVLKNRIAQE